jgi:hypothetical protein
MEMEEENWSWDGNWSLKGNGTNETMDDPNNPITDDTFTTVSLICIGKNVFECYILLHKHNAVK